jgi:chaperonin GroES
LIITKSNDSTSDLRFGKAISVGPGKVADNGELIPMHVKVGDTVYYQYGMRVVIEGKNFMLLTESGDVVGIKVKN